MEENENLNQQLTDSIVSITNQNTGLNLEKVLDAKIRILEGQQKFAIERKKLELEERRLNIEEKNAERTADMEERRFAETCRKTDRDSEIEDRKFDLDAKRIQQEHESRERETSSRNKRELIHSAPKLLAVLAVIGVIVCLLLATHIIKTPSQVSVPKSAKDYRGESYETVKNSLIDAGFSSRKIRCVGLNDLGMLHIGKDEGDVTRITIAGVDNFKKGQVFSNDASIRIEYHSKKE